MSRHATERPGQEHHAVLSRVYRQLSVSTMPEARRKELLEHLSASIRLIEVDLGERPAAIPAAPAKPRKKRRTT